MSINPFAFLNILAASMSLQKAPLKPLLPFRQGRYSTKGELNPAGAKISRLASRGMLGVRCIGLQVHRDSQGRTKLVSRR